MLFPSHLSSMVYYGPPGFTLIHAESSQEPRIVVRGKRYIGGVKQGGGPFFVLFFFRNIFFKRHQITLNL